MSRRAVQVHEQEYLDLIADRIQHLRHDVRRESQMRLAVNSGSSLSTISRIERGKLKGATLLKIKAVADALGVTMSTLFNLSANQGQNESPVDSELQLLFELAKSAPESQKRLAKSILQAAFGSVGSMETAGNKPAPAVDAASSFRAHKRATTRRKQKTETPGKEQSGAEL